jgi:hypothetical protein
VLAQARRAKVTLVRRPKAESVLGETLLSQKKLAEAGPLLVQGYDDMKQREAKILSPFRTIRLKDCLQRLIALYDAMDKKPEAAKYRKQLDALTKAAKELPKK